MIAIFTKLCLTIEDLSRRRVTAVLAFLRDRSRSSSRSSRGADVRYRASPEDVIGYLRERQITLTYDPASGTLDAGTAEAAQTITLTAS